MDFTVKHGGRGFEFRCFVNTPEDPMVIAKRLEKALRGQEKSAHMIMVAVLTPKETAEFLKKCAEMEIHVAMKEEAGT